MPANPDDALGAGSVEPLVRKTAAWSWRLLVILTAVVALLWVVKRLEIIVVPVLLALMISALLVPAVDWLDRRGLPRGGAVARGLAGRIRDSGRHPGVRHHPVHRTVCPI